MSKKPKTGDWRIRVSPHTGEAACQRWEIVCMGSALFGPLMDWNTRHTARNEAEAREWINREVNGWRTVEIETP